MTHHGRDANMTPKASVRRSSRNVTLRTAESGVPVLFRAPPVGGRNSRERTVSRVGISFVRLLFFMQKADALLRYSSFFVKGHVQVGYSLAGALITPLFHYQPFTSGACGAFGKAIYPSKRQALFARAGTPRVPAFSLFIPSPYKLQKCFCGKGEGSVLYVGAADMARRQGRSEAKLLHVPVCKTFF